MRWFALTSMCSGSLVGRDYSRQGFPVELRKTTHRGRIMVWNFSFGSWAFVLLSFHLLHSPDSYGVQVATRDIKAGQPAMRVMHYTTNVSEDFAARVCSTCSKEHDHPLVRYFLLEAPGPAVALLANFVGRSSAGCHLPQVQASSVCQRPFLFARLAARLTLP
jgi:hypothetical protein